jgi:hypothetical protein
MKNMILLVKSFSVYILYKEGKDESLFSIPIPCLFYSLLKGINICVTPSIEMPPFASLLLMANKGEKTCSRVSF